LRHHRFDAAAVDPANIHVVPRSHFDSGCQNSSATPTVAAEQHRKQGLILGFESCRTAP
jgi:hypothetical protein